MSRLDFGGRCVVVTGAGRGLGREYALALGRYGASVVVNDLGAQLDGGGVDAGPARAVVAEIEAAGGIAVANGDDVSNAQGAERLIAAAVERFGRVDALVNNAGICRDKAFAEMSAGDFEQVWRVNVLGHVFPTQAAWRVMARQGYGRVVMTGSGAGMFGLENETGYAASKGAVHGLMRSLAVEGRALNIKVNSICPGGVSRMHEQAFPNPEVLAMMRELMPPALVAPAVVWLASEACDVTGESFSVWGGRVARIQVASGAGLLDRRLSAEGILENTGKVMAPEALYAATDGVDDVAHWRGKILQ